ncbi:hypothetical protein TrST_g8948 [Triparma strigata]|uniref:VPS9 domain-containing protein n=1 Tax=Triparma strigata TaxID=1606541 RepID=A0A9W7F273_9STRA|nr:hypothetical protein TrST_g8948 [Triparma strigata]
MFTFILLVGVELQISVRRTGKSPSPKNSPPDSQNTSESLPTDIFTSLKSYSSALSASMARSSITFSSANPDPPPSEEMVTFNDYDSHDSDSDGDIDIFGGGSNTTPKPDNISFSNPTEDLTSIIHSKPASPPLDPTSSLTSLPIPSSSPPSPPRPRTSSLQKLTTAASKTANLTRRTSTTVGTTLTLPFRLTKNYILGTLVGGTAGLLISGPAGIIIGGKIGQSIGTGSVLVSSLVTIGGAVAGGEVGEKQGDKIEKYFMEGRRRSIKLLKLGGENKKKVRTDREFILMRTQESVPENWEVVVESFKKRHRSEHSKGIMESIFGRNEEERTSRTDDLDILGMTEEECGGLNAKIILLVSRVLKGDTEAGYIYKEMCNEYKSRYGDNPSQGNIKIAEDSKGFKVDETNTPTSDAHAIIYHVTKSFLETTKMNIGSGKAITTACLNAVDACVFGNCYANVYVDLKEMVKEEDKKLNDNVEVFFRDHVDDAMEEIIMQEIKWDAVEALRYLRSKCYTAADKLAMCVKALEEIDGGRCLSGDELLTYFIKHVVVLVRGSTEEKTRPKLFWGDTSLHADLKVIEEFCRDEYLMLGKEGYSMAIFQSALLFLKNIPSDKYKDEIWEKE